MKDTMIQWHPGFVAAMNLELAENREDLIFEKEYNLNLKPLEIDLLVIKKESSVQIKNEIGGFFKSYNIMEYKSPNDQLNIDTFYKTTAYACLYKSYGKYVDERSAYDITISIVREMKPEGLFRYFEKHEITVLHAFPGIYYILKDVMFPTQIVVTRELSQKDHTWLKALSDQMEAHDMRSLVEHIRDLELEIDKEYADSVLEVSVRANQQIVKEIRGGDDMCQALLEIMEPEILKIKKEAEESASRQGFERGLKKGIEQGIEKGIEQGIEQGKEQGIKNLVNTLRDLGHDEDEIRAVVMDKYHLSKEKIDEYM